MYETGPSQPRPVGRVDQALAESSAAIGHIHDRIGELESRLSQLLSPLPPQPAKADVTGVSKSDQLADRIFENARNMGGAVERLQSLIGRLEL
jgi:hypothetical protein